MFSWTLMLTGGVKTDMIKHKSIVGQTCGPCVVRTAYMLAGCASFLSGYTQTLFFALCEPDSDTNVSKSLYDS